VAHFYTEWLIGDDVGDDARAWLLASTEVISRPIAAVVGPRLFTQIGCVGGTPQGMFDAVGLGGGVGGGE
jgi:hypothetical protein